MHKRVSSTLKASPIPFTPLDAQISHLRRRHRAYVILTQALPKHTPNSAQPIQAHDLRFQIRSVTFIRVFIRHPERSGHRVGLLAAFACAQYRGHWLGNVLSDASVVVYNIRAEELVRMARTYGVVAIASPAFFCLILPRDTRSFASRQLIHMLG